jgi:hypothetical protein
MFMGPEKGHRGRVDDWTAVTEVAATIFLVAQEYVFPGEPEFLKELPARSVKGASFDAYFRIQSDRLDWASDEERSMVVVRFARAGEPLTNDPWALRVRGTWPTRRDRLRDASPFSSKSLRRVIRTDQLKVTHENLWVSESTLHSDLESQVALFLLQAELVPADGSVRDSLITHLRSEFRWRGIDDPDGTVYQVFEHLRKHKWWSEDWRSWRLYVRQCINGEAKKQRHRSAIVPNLTPDEDGDLTVIQFALLCRMSKSKGYTLIQAGKVSTVRKGAPNRLMVPFTEAEQFRKEIRRRDVIDCAAKTRSREAARKWVHRQEASGKTLNEIARALVGV